DADELFGLAQFVGCTRPGFVTDPATLGQIPADRVTMIEVPALAISSTDVRRRTMRGEPVWYLVPDGVVQYIAKHHLYPRGDAGDRPAGRAPVSHDSASHDSASHDSVSNESTA
ncbi:MAG TPA: hypothetical protein VMT27_07275, partial [Actinomycetes bacterium]|nr:hypothetical protein [Actinomycetes bacterium]